jgi:hypothetical protein
MFTWISKSRHLALILFLAACQMEPGGFAPAGQTRVISVLGGAMQVAAPSGYCVDRKSAREQADGAVVLMGRCSGGSNLAPAVITVTIGAAGSAGVVADGGVALAAFFQTAGGRTALSRAGRADSVQIVQVANSDGAFTLRIAEAGVGDYWRAIVGISGRLVTLSVQGPAGSKLDPATGRKLLGASLLAMRKVNTRR